ncbi:MAG: excinuclease ABC subunit UvrC [Bacteroidota bacterium]
MDAGIIFRVDVDPVTLEERLQSLPGEPGVYQFQDAQGKVIYVGKAKNLRNRVRQYFQRSRPFDPRLAALVSRIANVEIIVTDSEVESLILEANLIKRLKPRYNVNLKDDKSYPYIVVTNEPYPRVAVTRRIVRDGSRYFGPFTEVKTLRSTLKTLRDVFRIRSCRYYIDEEVIQKKKIRVCLDYHIKKCDGPCEGLISQQAYNDMIREVEKLLSGRTGSLVRELEARMKTLADEMRFEEAAEVRDKIEALKVYEAKQKVVTLEKEDRDVIGVASAEDDACGVVFKVREGKLIGSHHYYLTGAEGRTLEELASSFVSRYYLDTDDVPREVFLPVQLSAAESVEAWLTSKRGEEVKVMAPQSGDKVEIVKMAVTNAKLLLDELQLQRAKQADFVPHSVQALQRDLRLPVPPRRIECFDISNIQGSDTVASMVTFVDGSPKKSEYRKFKVRTVEGPDDFASMREVIRRRYQRMLEENTERPDLIMVDGGKGQLSATVAVLKELQLESIPVIGLAKRLEEVYVPYASDPLQIAKTSSGLRLLQRIRDEAHRFAIAYHRLLRSKRTIRTELEAIPGIGPKRAKKLLEHFGSMKMVLKASEVELAAVVGKSVAQKLKEAFAQVPEKQIGGELSDESGT